MMKYTVVLSLPIAVATLAACGGGGSGTSPKITPPAAPPAGSPVQTGLQSPVQAGSQSAQSGFAPISARLQAAALVNGPAGARLLSIGPARARTFSSSPACNSGTIVTTTPISASESTIETKQFYDAACTQLALDAVDNVTSTPPNGYDKRIAKLYNRAGLLMATQSDELHANGAAGNGSTTLTTSTTIGTATVPATTGGSQLTVAPSAAAAGTWTLSGDTAAVVNDASPGANLSFGFAQTLSDTVTADAASDVTFSGALTQRVYAGALDSLSVSLTPPFAVSGGTNVSANQANGSVDVNAAGQLLSVNVTVNGSNGYTTVLTSTGNAPAIAIAGTITGPDGKTAATLAVDAFGNGTITFANGAQAVVVGWNVVG